MKTFILKEKSIFKEERYHAKVSSSKINESQTCLNKKADVMMTYPTWLAFTFLLIFIGPQPSPLNTSAPMNTASTETKQ